MWHYILLSLQRQRGRSTLASVGFLLVACAFILLSATTQTTVLQAQQIISKNWRPTYDLVVLPPQTHVPTNTTIPADLLEGYDGGITLSQYRQIQSIPGVAVAAPLAFVGYMRVPRPSVQFATQILPSGTYRVTWALSASDGRRTVLEHQESEMIYQASSCTINETFFQLEEEGVDVECNHLSKGSFLLPVTGVFLLAAIDPTAEEQLVHLRTSLVSGRMLTPQDTIHLDPQNPSLAGPQGLSYPNNDIPVLVNTHLPGQITLHATFARIASPTLSLQQIVDRGGGSYLAHLPEQHVLFQGGIPIAQQNPAGFPGANIVWNGHEWQTPDQFPNLLDFLFTPSGLTYQPTIAPAAQQEPAYRLVPTGVVGPEGAFRTLQSLPGVQDSSDTGNTSNFYTSLLKFGTLYNGSFYEFTPVGQFNGTGVAAQFRDVLNWLPENTYTSPPVVLRYDAQGHAVPPTTLQPTSNPAGFILQPPLALTTLAAAEQLKGPAFISTIRVRVAGNVTPDDAGWKRVSLVAQAIEQRTGLHVLVTLGSSPKPTLVYVPGLKAGQDGATQDIAPIGWAEERWIAIGAGIVYLHQVGATQTLLLGTVLLVCLGYLIVTLSSLVTAQRRELAILSALGWRPWHPIGTFLSQTLLLALGGGLLGIGVALLIIVLIGVSPPWLIVVWTLPVVIGLALLSALYPLWQMWQITPAEILRAGASISAEKNSRLGRLNTFFWSRLPAIGGMALRNLARSRWRAVIAIGSLFLSAMLLTVMVDGLLAFRQTLQGTLLGEYVLLQTAVPQLAGAIFALLLTFLSVADLLILQVQERQKEIGLLQAIGWRPRLVQRLFVQEGLTLALLGTVPGVVVALWVLSTQHATSSPIPAPVVAMGAVVVILLVAGLATIPAVRAVNRLPLSVVLRAD
ncbi:MAG: FtsX-like permease family protein [Ktedonobacteraceae bacterium]